MSTILEEAPTRIDKTQQEPDKCAHIAKSDGTKTGVALVLEARVMGTEVEALCGYRFVPSKDPKSLPVCQECKDIYDAYGALNGGYTPMPEV